MNAQRVVRIELPATRRLIPADEQTMKTLEAANATKTCVVYLEPNPETDQVIHNADGTITLVSQTVNINGMQWIVPAGVETRLPVFVVRHLEQCAVENRERCPIASYNKDLGAITRVY